MEEVKFISVPSKRLKLSISPSDSSFKLSDILGWDGVALTAADFGGQLYAVFRNDTNTVMEIMEIDPLTIASASISIVSRGLKFNGDLTTSVPANKLTWIKNTTIVEIGTDVPQLLNHMVQIAGEQTINDKKTFTTIPSSTDTPTNPSDLATKVYVDALVTGGSVTYDAQTTAGTAGDGAVVDDFVYFDEALNAWYLTDGDVVAKSQGVKIGIIVSVGSGTQVVVATSGFIKGPGKFPYGVKYYLRGGVAGDIDVVPGAAPRYVGISVSGGSSFFLETNDDDTVMQLGTKSFGVDAGSTDDYAITLPFAPPSYYSGLIVFLKPNTTNTAACTVNVNGLGAKSIKKESTLDPASGDLVVGQIYALIYDGTNFQVLNPHGAVPTGVVSMFAAASAPTGYLLCDGSAVSRTTYATLFAIIGTGYGAGDGSTTFNVPDFRSRFAVGAGTGTYAITFANTSITVANPGVITLSSTAALYTGMPIVLSNPGTVPTGFVTATTYYVIIVDSTHIQLASTMANAVAGTGIQCTGQGNGTNTLTVTFGAYTIGQQGGEEKHALVTAELAAHTHSSNNTNQNWGPNGGGTVAAQGGNTGSTGGSGAHNNLPPYVGVAFIIKI